MKREKGSELRGQFDIKSSSCRMTIEWRGKRAVTEIYGSNPPRQRPFVQNAESEQRKLSQSGSRDTTTRMPPGYPVTRRLSCS